MGPALLKLNNAKNAAAMHSLPWPGTATSASASCSVKDGQWTWGHTSRRRKFSRTRKTCDARAWSTHREDESLVALGRHQHINVTLCEEWAMDFDYTSRGRKFSRTRKTCDVRAWSTHREDESLVALGRRVMQGPGAHIARAKV